jgi:hypothetical protein
LDKKNETLFICHKSINHPREREKLFIENNITQNGAFSLSLSLSLALSVVLSSAILFTSFFFFFFFFF